MKRFLYLMSMALLLATVSPSYVHAGTSPIVTMAGIVMHLNHYPSDSEKRTLQQISDDKNATAGERTLAGALMRMQHRVGSDDADKLNALKGDPKAPLDERELADILLGIAHHPSADDQQRLKKLMHE